MQDNELTVDEAAHEEGYSGPATLFAKDQQIAIQVELRGYFEPIDGRYHWYGRLKADPALDDLLTGRITAELHTPEGSAPVSRLGDADTWGRLRISGVGRPPFKFAASLADVEQ
jgi:hypothetical protein